MKTFIKLTFFLVSLSSFLYAQRTEINIPLIKKVPIIDALDNDDCWQDIPWYGGFTLLNQVTEKAAQDTNFKIAHDNHNIYFLIKAFEKHPGNLKAVQTERDGKIWSDDCIELFIDPNQTADRFYHFAINSRGVFSDAEHVQGGNLRVIDWDSAALQCAAKVLSDSFMVELAIPIVDLGFERTDGHISFNIGRESYSTGKHIVSSFIPLTGGFHQPSLFNHAQLQDCDLAHFAWKLRSPYEVQLIKRDGDLKYEGKIHIINESGKQGFAELEMSLQNAEKFKENILLAEGLGREYKFSLNAETEPETQMLLIELKDRKTKQALARRLLPITIKYNPLTLKLSSPPYRDNIYSDMKLNEIVGKLDIHDATAEALAVKFILVDSTDKKISEVERIGEGKFSLPIPELADGKYRLQVQVGDYKTEKIIRKLPKVPGEVRFDENKVMYVDGKKVIPYGWFSFPINPQLSDISAIGYTLNFDYTGSYVHGKALQERFDLFANAGMKSAIYSYTSESMFLYDAMQKPLTPKEAEAIRKRVRELKNHPGLLGWYLADEPELRAALPSRLKEVHDICKEEDPYHPTIMLNTTVAGIHKYADIGDISMPDIYPSFVAEGDAGVDLAVIFNSNMAGNDSSDRINWFTPQGFNWADYGRPGQRAPNFMELRNMQYQAILSGATGFCWYSWRNLECYPEVYLGVNHLLQESKVLSDIWLNPQKRVLIASDSPKIIAANYPDLNGVDYIVAINTTTQTKEIELTAKENRYHAVGENKAFDVRNNKLSDRLEKYQVRVYSSSKSIADSFDLNAYKPLVEKAKQDLRKEGNLAYADKTGVQFELIINDPPRYPAWHLGDGSYKVGMNIPANEQGKAIIQITFPEKVKASQLKMFGNQLQEAEVEIEENGKWIKIAELNPVTDKIFEAEWKATEVDKIRVVRIKARNISEIEVY